MKDNDRVRKMHCEKNRVIESDRKQSDTHREKDNYKIMLQN